MIIAPYSAMHTRMKICEMPTAARRILDQYQAQLRDSGRFDLNQFLVDLCQTCRCRSRRATTEMISVLWHSTRDPALVYYLEHSEDRQPEFEYYLRCAYGAKHNRPHRPITILKEEYWMAFRAANNDDVIIAN